MGSIINLQDSQVNDEIKYKIGNMAIEIVTENEEEKIVNPQEEKEENKED